MNTTGAALRELLLKEARLLARRPREALMPLAFSAVIGLGVATIAIEASTALSGLVASQLFFAYYSVVQGITREQIEGSLEGIRLSPSDPLLPLSAKTVSTLFFILLGGLSYITVLSLLSSPPPASPEGLIAWTLAISPGLASISGLASSILAYSDDPGILATHVTAALSAPLYLATLESGLRSAAGDPAAAVQALPASLAVTLISSAFAKIALD